MRPAAVDARRGDCTIPQILANGSANIPLKSNRAVTVALARRAQQFWSNRDNEN
jgi:hypothetical protein